jgi:hypothetical protein
MLIPAANRTIPIGNPTIDSMSAEPSMASGVPRKTPDIETRSCEVLRVVVIPISFDVDGPSRATS